MKRPRHEPQSKPTGVGLPVHAINCTWPPAQKLQHVRASRGLLLLLLEQAPRPFQGSRLHPSRTSYTVLISKHTAVGLNWCSRKTISKQDASCSRKVLQLGKYLSATHRPANDCVCAIVLRCLTRFVGLHSNGNQLFSALLARTRGWQQQRPLSVKLPPLVRI